MFSMFYKSLNNFFLTHLSMAAQNSFPGVMRRKWSLSVNHIPEREHSQGNGMRKVITFHVRYHKKWYGTVHGKWLLHIVKNLRKCCCFVTVLQQYIGPITFTYHFTESVHIQGYHKGKVSTFHVPYPRKGALSRVWYAESVYFPGFSQIKICEFLRKIATKIVNILLGEKRAWGNQFIFKEFKSSCYSPFHGTLLYKDWKVGTVPHQICKVWWAINWTGGGLAHTD